MREVKLYVGEGARVTVSGGIEYAREETATDPVMGYREAKRNKYQARRGQLGDIAEAIDVLEAEWPTLDEASRHDRVLNEVLPAIRTIALALRFAGDIALDINEDAGPGE